MTKPTIEIERWNHYGEGTLAVIDPHSGMLATIPSEWKPALLAALLEGAGAVKVEVSCQMMPPMTRPRYSQSVRPIHDHITDFGRGLLVEPGTSSDHWLLSRSEDTP